MPKIKTAMRDQEAIMPFRSNAKIDKYIIILSAVVLTITVNLFRLIFPYPIFRDDAFAPGGIVSSLASVHALFDRGYSSIYEFAGSGIDLAGNGFLPHTVSFVLVGMTYLLGVSWAIKSTVLLKALLGFYFTSLYLRTRYSMGLIESIFGGLLFSIQTQIVPVQASSQTLDQFGAGLSVDLIPAIIYALYVLGLDNTIAKQRILSLSIMFVIGLLYALSSTIPYLPICLGFIVVWFLCERAFGIDRLALLSAFLCGAGIAMLPIFYAFVLDHAYSARKGFNNFSFYNEGGLKTLILGYTAAFTSFLMRKKEFFLLIFAALLFVPNKFAPLIYRVTIFIIFVLFAIGGDFLQPSLSILFGEHLGIVRSVSLYTNFVSAFPLALLSAWGLSVLRDYRLKIVVFACAIIADISFQNPGNLWDARTVSKSDGYIYNADILLNHDKLKRLAHQADGGRLSTISVVGDRAQISMPGFHGNWLNWLFPILPQAYGIESTDSYVNLSPQFVKDFYEKRIGNLGPDPIHSAYIETSFDGHIKYENGCFIQTAPIDLDSAGIEIGALRDAAVKYVISSVALHSHHLRQDELSDSGSELGCTDRGYLVWPERLERPKVFIYRTDWTPEFVSVTRNVALNSDDVSENSRRSRGAPAERGPLVFLDEEDLRRLPGMSEAPTKSDELEIRERRSDLVRATVKLTAPALVYFSYGFEWGWRGTIDGEDAKILRANFGFQAVWVPAGSHEVEIRRPALPFTHRIGD